MSEDRFQDAKRIFAEALDREPAQRDEYLREACGEDGRLKQDVESLLQRRDDAEAFFEERLGHVPALRAAVVASVVSPPVDLTGRTLEHYTILKKIGEGGMGLVYQARDTRLDRLVALKVLPPERVADPERLRRFVHEARAASALNHPNIVTIHDIDAADGITFIVMEYVRGTTLDELIRRGRIAPRDALAHAIQIADALAAAHGAGIVHRDVKPANIMLTEGGLVKVLDFGLAKLDQPADGAPGVSAQETSIEEGLILGTVAYMSPEQARGKDVDARSDIFSFGAVLYELIAGRRAFSGGTSATTVAAIVGTEPRSFRDLAVDAPPGLEGVVRRCLEKDRERRFQHASEVKAALEGLLRQWSPEARAAANPTAGSARRRLAWVAGACLLAASVGLAGWRSVLRRTADAPDPLVSALTVVPGSQLEPALSHDGRQVAFLWDGDIHVQLVGETTPRRVTSSAEAEHSPAWSPDARRLAFLRITAAGTAVMIATADGGAERRLLLAAVPCATTVAKHFCGPAWAPDGRHLAVVDRESPRAPNSIFLVDVDTGERHRMTTPQVGSDDGLSAFSPDGRTLAFARRSGWPLSDLYVLRLDDRLRPAAEPVRLTHDNSFIWGFDWTADGRDLVFSSSRGGVDSLWRVDTSGGPPRGLPIGGNSAFFPSLSRRGNRLVFTYGRANLHLWRVAAPGDELRQGPPPPPTQISHSPRWDQQPAFSPDGLRVAWASTLSGSHQIWVSGAGGEAPRQLTSLEPPGADMPAWSPDGLRIAFRGFRPGPRPDLYLVPADGGDARRLTTGALGVSAPAWASDGRWLYFSADRGDGPSVWMVPSDGGAALPVARGGGPPLASRDGNAVYYAGSDGGVWRSAADGAGSPVRLAPTGSAPFFEVDGGRFLCYRGPDARVWRVPATGGPAEPVVNAGRRAAWTVSATGIYVLDPDAAGGPAIEFATFDGRRNDIVRLPGEPSHYMEPIFETAVSLTASPDGRWVVYLRQDPVDRKIMLVENFR